MNGQTTHLHSNCLVILNCMNDEEVAPALRLAHDLRAGAAKAAGMMVRTVDCTRPVDLRMALTELAEAAVDGLLPAVHVDGHGAEEGLLTGDGSRVLWELLWPLFRTLNVATKNNLILTFASCWSAHGIVDKTSADLSLPTPFLVMVAPQKIVLNETVDAGFEDFYRSLIANGDVNAAFDLLARRDRAADTVGEYKLLIAPRLFALSAEKYVEQHCVGAAARARERNLESMRLGDRHTRRFVRNAIRGSQALYLGEKYRRFMMVDRYPDQAGRFPINLGALEARARRRARRP